MAIPVPHTWVAGTDNATSANMQTLTDTGLYLLGSATSTGDKKTVARLYQTSATTSLADSTWTSIGFDAEAFDYAGEHSTTVNTSRLTAAKPGVCFASGQIAYTGNATGGRRARFAVNGVEVTASAVQLPASTTLLFTVVIPFMPIFLNAGDYLEIQGWQSSGAALSTAISVANSAGASAMNVLWVSN